MKYLKICLIGICSLVQSMSFANSDNTTGVVPTYIIENGSIEFEVTNDQYTGYFVDLFFDHFGGNLELETKYKITYLEVLNANEQLECKVPVFTNHLNLDLNDFVVGKYILLLHVKGEPRPISAVFVKK